MVLLPFLQLTTVGFLKCPEDSDIQGLQLGRRVRRHAHTQDVRIQKRWKGARGHGVRTVAIHGQQHPFLGPMPLLQLVAQKGCDLLLPAHIRHVPTVGARQTCTFRHHATGPLHPRSSRRHSHT
eukprot:jgi/Mesvir1/19609/Mv25170-RA.1